MNEPPTIYASKKMHYAQLREEIDKLNKNIKQLEANIKVTAEQVPTFRKMGSLHASILMSVKSVLNDSGNDRPTS
ncbi:uncharacterized protein BX663DRAFT_523485 [Cokeromyces recurvatus]|uniref:uncharacterized protein n=1 Tax=Cokeromyces recurvatus TaxID=90255 RepID=UPI00221FB08E|nr:uncharacterized protein BX663DRAFT_523485 [Cokeromyces recurvatus]KAI7898793.1 hypothetical protein BX663DRAFT_523485 [Cokeromyces recurvatus]